MFFLIKILKVVWNWFLRFTSKLKFILIIFNILNLPKIIFSIQLPSAVRSCQKINLHKKKYLFNYRVLLSMAFPTIRYVPLKCPRLHFFQFVTLHLLKERLILYFQCTCTESVRIFTDNKWLKVSKYFTEHQWSLTDLNLKIRWSYWLGEVNIIFKSYTSTHIYLYRENI